MVLCFSFLCNAIFLLLCIMSERMCLCWFYASTFFERVLSIYSGAVYDFVFVHFMLLLLFLVILIRPP